jgi:thymidylate synthase
MMLSYNPADDNDYYKAPLGCHTLAQFHVRGNKLSCSLTQRSGDLFLGVPYNIACYALLTETLAYVAGLRAGTLIHTIGDAHIYANHFDQVREQLTREPRPLPRLQPFNIFGPSDRAVRDLVKEEMLQGKLTAAHFNIEGYDPHPALKGEVAI